MYRNVKYIYYYEQPIYLHLTYGTEANKKEWCSFHIKNAGSICYTNYVGNW